MIITLKNLFQNKVWEKKKESKVLSNPLYSELERNYNLYKILELTKLLKIAYFIKTVDASFFI